MSGCERALGSKSVLPKCWSYGAFGDALQGHAGRAVGGGPLVLLQGGRDPEADVRFVTSRVGQRRVVLSVANVGKDEANDSADEGIWARKEQSGRNVSTVHSNVASRVFQKALFPTCSSDRFAFSDPLKGERREKRRQRYKSWWPLQTCHF